MNDAVALLRALPLEVFERPKPNDAWERCPLAMASDEILIGSVIAAITCPKIQIDSSFLMHAPLELLARVWLLQHLRPHERGNVRRGIAEIAVRYAAEGPEIESKPRGYSTVDYALTELVEALRAGDADGVDGALLFLLPRVGIERLRGALAEEVLSYLGAAGHAPILLMMLQGAEGRFPGVGSLLRSPLRAVALEAGVRLTWVDTVVPTPVGEAGGLFECLAALPSRIAVSSHSIATTMLAVERDGYAASVLAFTTNALGAREAERILLRVAALSMLEDDPEHAPYGWSHCFTLPQGILSLADVTSDVTRVVRVAATHVLGFRATLGAARLYMPGRRIDAVLGSDPTDAVAVAFNSTGDQRRSIRGQLIERAAAHADAHLAKYTMACLIAADRDPEESGLYLAAATYLGEWWDRRELK